MTTEAKKHRSSLATLLQNTAKKVTSVDNIELPSSRSISEHEKANLIKTTNPTSFIKSSTNPTSDEEAVYLEVDPNLVDRWAFKDRHEEELGDIEGLEKDFKNPKIGQLQPCIIRLSKIPGRYDLIIGERRWLAAKRARTKLKAFQKDLSDEEASLIQIMENLKREDISEYSQGVNYSKLIEAGFLTQKQLQQTLNISQSSIRNLLSFSKIDKKITDAMPSLKKLSARTAYEITLLQAKGEKYVSALIGLAPKISRGIGAGTLKDITSQLATNAVSQNETIVSSKSGRHIFSWRKDSNGHKSISFPKDIRGLIDYNKVEKILLKEVEEQLKALESE